MPFTKIFGTTSGSYSTATNWKPIDLTSPDHAWTASGSGTNEYYVRTAANGDPGFVAQPANVYINGSNAAEGTAGSLTAGQWDYADNDTLGYSTVYVRLSGGGDPDAQDPGHVKFYQIPQATEHVKFAADSASINSAVGLDQSGVAIGDFIVEDGYAGAIGSATLGYLIIDPNKFEFGGSGASPSYINLYTANIPFKIHKTGQAANGLRGLYLRGSNLTVGDIMGGTIGIASNGGETATVATLRVLGSSSLWLGSGLSLTTLDQYSGTTVVRCGSTTTRIYGGTITSEDVGAVTTLNMFGGTYVYKSTGTIGTVNMRGGSLDCTQSGSARTITTLNKYLGNYSISRSKEAVTVTNDVPQESYTETVTANSGGSGGFF